MKLAIELYKYIQINDYAIELVDNQKPPYNLIYSLGPVELEILKIYFKYNVANSFIRPSKFFARALIFFNKNLDRNLQLYINYQDFNSLIIKNHYPLLLVRKSLDQLDKA